MDIEHITENLQSIVAGAREIELALDSSSGGIGEALELYEALDSNGTTTDSDEIIRAVEFYAELEGSSTSYRRRLIDLTALARELCDAIENEGDSVPLAQDLKVWLDAGSPPRPGGQTGQED